MSGRALVDVDQPNILVPLDMSISGMGLRKFEGTKIEISWCLIGPWNDQKKS